MLLCLCMFLKICSLHVHMWDRGTERKSVLSFPVFELFAVNYLWLRYEREGMSRTTVLFQRVITAGIWFGLLLLGIWWLIFQV